MGDDRLDDAIDAVVRAVDRIERATRGEMAVPPPPEPAAAATPTGTSAEIVPTFGRQSPVPHDVAEPALAPNDRSAPEAPAPLVAPVGSLAPELGGPASPTPSAPRLPLGPPQMTANTGAFWLPRSDDLEPVELVSGFSSDAPTTPLIQQRITAHEVHELAGPTQPQLEQPYDVTDSSPAAHAALAGAPLPALPETTAESSAPGAATPQPLAEHGASPEIHELVGRIAGQMQSMDDHIGAASQLRGEVNELVARLAAAAVKPR